MFAASLRLSSTFARRSLMNRRVCWLSTTAAARPFQILGIQQVAIGCEEKSPLDALWKDIFGFQASASKRLEKENVEEDILKVGPSPFEVEVDLMVPIDKDKSPKVSIMCWR
jgi:lactoylglutathione lyase